ncbi:MAG: flagellar hook capping protein [Lachnospiraceae bacterium]|nr:flagellar hook capping protein [Lachnospiraceae bacterium]
MGITAQVINGKIQQNVTQTTNNSSINTESASQNKSLVDEETFLSLLVAEMQYQDPLEPTSNSEYVSELASFTQVSSLTEMNATMTGMSTQNLVGKYVTILTDEGKEIVGQVDYTQVKDGKTYISVNDNLYDPANVEYVLDSNYYEANLSASSFNTLVQKLPKEKEFTLADKDAIDNITAARTLYDSMDNYTKQFVQKTDLEKLESLEAKLKKLKEEADNTTGSSDTDTTSESAESTVTG